jgi:hypothetical protein
MTALGGGASWKMARHCAQHANHAHRRILLTRGTITQSAARPYAIAALVGAKQLGRDGSHRSAYGRKTHQLPWMGISSQ